MAGAGADGCSPATGSTGPVRVKTMAAMMPTPMSRMAAMMPTPSQLNGARAIERTGGISALTALGSCGRGDLEGVSALGAGDVLWGAGRPGSLEARMTARTGDCEGHNGAPDFRHYRTFAPWQLARLSIADWGAICATTFFWRCQMSRNG